MAKLAIYQLTLSSDPMGQLRGETCISNQPGLKGKSNGLNWMKAYHSSKLYKEQMKK